MSRAVPEWIGATPDTAIPPRVRVRVFDRAGKACEVCDHPIRGGDKWQADHIVALKNGGENRETNLQCLCEWCHKAKTAGDVAEKSKVYRKRAKHIGLKAKSRFANSRSGPYITRIGGKTERRV